MLATFVRRAVPKTRGAIFRSKQFSSATGALADVCNINIVSSPFPPIMESTHYTPVSEFVSAEWKDVKWAKKVAIRDGNTEETRTFADYNTYM